MDSYEKAIWDYLNKFNLIEIFSNVDDLDLNEMAQAIFDITSQKEGVTSIVTCAYGHTSGAKKLTRSWTEVSKTSYRCKNGKPYLIYYNKK
jgi:hypothetical protein